MSRPPIPIAALIWISLLLGVTGCASTKDSVLPQDGPTMKQIYDRHFEELRGHTVEGARAALTDGSGTPRPSRRIAPAGLDLKGYTRDAHNEIEALFTRLPNPTLVMFVYPHLSGQEGVPVPGYATSFPMYEQVEYALPGEVPSFQE